MLKKNIYTFEDDAENFVNKMMPILDLGRASTPCVHSTLDYT